MNVVLAGGGTAGHVEPALALADTLRARGHAVSLVGTPRGIETRLVPARGHELDVVPPVPLPRHVSSELFRVPFRLRRSVREARAILERRKADAVVGFGGYAALPVYLAARRRVPVVVHEANVKPGLANRVGARFAAVVATSYASTELPRARLVGIPLRPGIGAASREEGRAAFGLADEPTLLVFGGSQGARRINEAVAGIAGEVQVLHATGTSNYDSVVASGAAGDRYVALPYIERMDLAYAAADLAVCRAGAMTVAELTAAGLPAVYVPLPHGNGEQRLNAAHVIEAGGGIEIPDAGLDAARLRRDVVPLLRDPVRLGAMREAARSVGRPDAAGVLADLVEGAAR